jgi:predicted transcriptional regulator
MTLDLFRHDFILSIKPEYATRIVDGQKTVELRRRFLDLTVTGAKMYVYATVPIQALIGYATIERVLRMPVAAIWREYHRVAFISQPDFEEYFQGRDVGFVLVLRDPVKLSAPIPLSVLKQQLNFTPPQSFAYADEALSQLVDAA